MVEGEGLRKDTGWIFRVEGEWLRKDRVDTSCISSRSSPARPKKCATACAAFESACAVREAG